MLPFVKWAGGKDFSLNFSLYFREIPLNKH